MVTISELPPGKEYALLKVEKGGLYKLLLIGAAAHQVDEEQFFQIVSGFVNPEAQLVLMVNEADASSFRTDVANLVPVATTTTTTLPA